MTEPANKPELPLLTHYCLLLSLPVMALPHLNGLPWWVFVCSGFVACWQFAVCRWRWAMPPAWLRSILAVGSFVLIVSHYRSIHNLDAYVALLVMMHAQKILELANRRDVMLTVFIGMFCIGTRLLYTQSLYAMLIAVGAMMLQFFTLHSFYATKDSSLLQAFKNICWLLLKAAPLVLVLFFLFPRLPPLLVIPEFGTSGVSGVSDTVSPGSLSSLARSSAPAFRVSFDGPKPTTEGLYWRGMVLERFDGRTWHRGGNVQATQRDWLRDADDEGGYRYTITMQPTNQNWLFTLPVSYGDQQTADLTGYVVAAKEPIAIAQQFEFQSKAIALAEGLSASRKRGLLRLPQNNNPRTVAFGQALAQRYNRNTADIVRDLAQFIASDFSYSLQPPLLGEHTADEFLFDTKAGYCEHFASAVGVALRAAGIPTRLVVGYQGGEQNPFEDYMLVRQLDAHAWLEYWVPESGWLRFDPTSLVAPERVSLGSEATLRQRNQYAGGAWGGLDFSFIKQFQLWSDSLNYQWTRWFLNYDRGQQFSLFENLTGLEGSLERLSQAFFVLAAAAFVPFFLYAILLRLRTSLPLALPLAFADKGLALAGMPRTISLPPSQVSLPSGAPVQPYRRLTELLNQRWYEAKPISALQWLQALHWSLRIFIWGFFRQFLVAAKKP